jgi:hypothetical protein
MIAVPMSSSSLSYLFRHALLRESVYRIQLPGERARLHAHAFVALRVATGDGPPAMPSLAGRIPEARRLLAKAAAIAPAGTVWRRGARLLRRVGANGEADRQVEIMRKACAKARIRAFRAARGLME